MKSCFTCIKDAKDGFELEIKTANSIIIINHCSNRCKKISEKTDKKILSRYALIAILGGS